MTEKMKRMRDEMARSYSDDQITKDFFSTWIMEHVDIIAFGVYRDGFDDCDKLWLEKTVKMAEKMKTLMEEITDSYYYPTLEEMEKVLAEFEGGPK